MEATLKQTFGVKHELQCNQCGWSGFEEELTICNEANEHNEQDKTLYFFKVCPECMSDDYLMDL